MFLPVAWTNANLYGVSGFIHPEGVYDDRKADGCEENIDAYVAISSLAICYVFSDIDGHVKYSINIYGKPIDPPKFKQSLIFLPYLPLIIRSRDNSGKGWWY